MLFLFSTFSLPKVKSRIGVKKYHLQISRIDSSFLVLLFRHKPNHVISSLEEKHFDLFPKNISMIWIQINYYPEATQAH